MQARTVRRIAMSLPQAEERETWGTPTFRVRNKIFAMFAEGGGEVWIKSTLDEQRALIAMEPGTYFHPAYVGSSGWVGVRYTRADRVEVEELLVEAWRMTAPKRLVAAFDDGAA